MSCHNTQSGTAVIYDRNITSAPQPRKRNHDQQSRSNRIYTVIGDAFDAATRRCYIPPDSTAARGARCPSAHTPVSSSTPGPAPLPSLLLLYNRTSCNIQHVHDTRVTRPSRQPSAEAASVRTAVLLGSRGLSSGNSILHIFSSMSFGPSHSLYKYVLPALRDKEQRKLLV